MKVDLPITILVVPASEDDESSGAIALVEAFLLVLGLSGILPWPDRSRYLVRVYDDSDDLVEEFEVDSKKRGNKIRKEIYKRVAGMSAEEVRRFNAGQLWNSITPD